MENEETVVPSEDVDGEEEDKVVCDSLSLATGLLTILPSNSTLNMGDVYYMYCQFAPLRKLSASLYMPCGEFCDSNGFDEAVGIANFSVARELRGVWSRELR